MIGAASSRRRGTKPWNASAGVRGFASAAIFYRSLLHRLPLAANDKDAMRAHLDIHQALGGLEATGTGGEIAAITTWLAAELKRSAATGSSPTYVRARLELLALLAQGLSKPASRAPEGAVFTDESSG